jgi:uncharacterized membrane protein HdeD (DUF308 family)
VLLLIFLSLQFVIACCGFHVACVQFVLDTEHTNLLRCGSASILRTIASVIMGTNPKEGAVLLELMNAILLVLNSMVCNVY